MAGGLVDRPQQQYSAKGTIVSLRAAYAFTLLLFTSLGALAVAWPAGYIAGYAPALGYFALGAGAVAGLGSGMQIWELVERS